jgi:hypothetical protein
LRKAGDSGAEPALQRAAAHLAAVRPSSRAFAEQLEDARAAVPRAFRGSYGVKLALRDETANQPLLGHPQTEQAIRTYLGALRTSDEARRKQLLDAVHPRKRDEPLRCSGCHRESGGAIAFEKSGYPAARARMLIEAAVVQMIENIAASRPFHLPGQGPSPASQPSSGG